MSPNEAVEFGEHDDSDLVINLADVEDGGFEVMPKAMYNVVLTELEFTFSQSSGNPMWSWTLEVEDGDFAGRKLFYHTVWAGKGLPMTKRTIARIFPTLMEGPFKPEEIANSGELLGTHLRARVGIQMYKAEGDDKPSPRNNIKGLFPAEADDTF